MFRYHSFIQQFLACVPDSESVCEERDTSYLLLYKDTAETCARRRWCAAMYGSVEELPPVQFSPKG